MMKKYEIIDHTADIGIRAFGQDLKELFVNAAIGMFEIIADLKNVRPDISVKIKLKAPDLEELLVSWLRELLYRWSTEEILFGDFVIEELTDSGLEARALGEKLDPERHELKTEIKAVTYHELKVQKAASAWTAQLIFDI